MERQTEPAQLTGVSADGNSSKPDTGSLLQEESSFPQNGDENNVQTVEKCGSEGHLESAIEKDDTTTSVERKTRQAQIWSETRSTLHAIEDMMSIRVKKKVNLAKNEQDRGLQEHLLAVEEASATTGESEEDSEDEFYDLERSESMERFEVGSMRDVPLNENISHLDTKYHESLPPWKEELECLVQGGVPMALRGEVRYNAQNLLMLFLLGSSESMHQLYLCNFDTFITALASLCGREGTQSGELLPGFACFRY